MRRLLFVVLLTGTGVLGATAVSGIFPGVAAGDDSSLSLTVHEWGTFTSVAGISGRAVDWQPAGGPSDLPCFVDSVVGQIKSGLRGKIRMETPVLYFYGASEEPIDVSVAFPDGRITEWFPRASLSDGRWLPVGTIEWRNVVLDPSASPVFPTEEGASHYYAARKTDAIPLRVGDDSERFLFYRGVGDFQPPITAQVSTNGESIHVANISGTPLPESPGEPVAGLVQFENRAGRIAYRMATVDELVRLNEAGTVTLPAAPYTRLETRLKKGSWQHDMTRLAGDLQSMLRRAGLYPREAEAMVETWRDSWFEEGSRIFYLVPEGVVDGILPLDIRPAPTEVRRVFVGRMEILTPATESAVLDAIRTGDTTALEPYGRFLEPILNQLVAQAALTGPAVTDAFRILDLFQDRFITQATRCN